MNVSIVTSETMASLVRLIDRLSTWNDGSSSLSLPMVRALDVPFSLQHDYLPSLPRWTGEKEANAWENVPPPVDRLPPEILQHIFRLATVQEKEIPCSLSYAPITVRDIWDLVEPIPIGTAIALVCRRWRSVFLDDATSWCLICDRQNPPSLTMARQSRATLELRLLATPSHVVRELLESEARRVRAIQWDKANARPCDLAILATPGCRLDKLVLNMNPHLPAVGADMLVPILHTQTAYLRWLTLRHCHALPQSCLPKLSGLHLDGCSGPLVSSGLYDLLARARALTDLVLSRMHLVDAAADSVTYTTLPLPSLRRLVFAEGISSDSVAALLRRVDLPVHTSIRIHATPEATLLAALIRTPAFRDATDVYVSSDQQDLLVAGPDAAVCFMAGRGVRHEILDHVVASTSPRKVWLLDEGPRVCRLRPPALPSSLDSIIVNDAGTGIAVSALEHWVSCAISPNAGLASGVSCHDHRSNRQPRRVTVQILMRSFMSICTVLAKLAHWVGTRQMHVVIGCLPTYKGDRACPPEFEDTFASLKVIDYVDEPKPVLPEICIKAEHCLWPAWFK